MRLLVSADIHLGSPLRSAALRNPELGSRLQQAGRDTFAGIIDLAVQEQVDALVLAGDIFDNGYPDLKTRAFLLTQLGRLSNSGIPTVLIRGNHDALLDHKAHGDPGPDIHLLHKGSPSVEIAGAIFNGLSFETAHVSKSQLPGYPQPQPGKLNIGLMHTSLDGASGHDPYAPCAEKDLMSFGYDLWCLGHIHSPFERVNGSVLAVMPGIPQPRHFGERAGGTVTLVSLDEATPQFERRAVAQFGFAECELPLQDKSDQQQVQNALAEALLSKQVPERDTAVRLHIRSARYDSELIRELAHQFLEDVDGVFIDKVRQVPVLPTAGEDTDDLLRLMREECKQEGFRQAALQQLDELRSVLPVQLRDELQDSELELLLEEATAQVSLSLRSGVSK